VIKRTKFQFHSSPQRLSYDPNDHDPNATGVDKWVHDRFPGQPNKVMFITAVWTGVALFTYTVLKIKNKMFPSKAKPVETVTYAPVEGDEVPSVDSPEFEKWLNTPGNVEKQCV